MQIILAPDAPRGCPIATAPPYKFILSLSNSRIFWFASTTAAYASLISKKSMSLIERLARFNALLIAVEGAVVGARTGGAQGAGAGLVGGFKAGRDIVGKPIKSIGEGILLKNQLT